MPRTLPIISILLLLVLIIAGIFVWYPKLEEFRGLGLDLKAKQETLQQKEEYFTKLESLEEQLASYEQEFQKINSALPEDVSKAKADILEFIQKASIENGLVLKKTTLSKVAIPKKGEKVFPEIYLTCALSGSYDAFKNFLNAIGNSSRMIETVDIKISPLKELARVRPNIAIDMLSFDLTLKAPYYLNITGE